MKKIAFIAFALLFAATLTAQDSGQLNCFAVLAGKGATIDGSVLLAHNEDDSGEQMINIYNVPRNSIGGNNKYIWVEFPGMEVADAFLNEYGVAVASDGCNSREDREDYTDGGVLYEVRTLVAQQARSARHAAELIGKIVQERGYRGSGRTYVVADCNEGWVVAVVRGRHWLAQRVPDNKVMTIPNYYCIARVDLADTANFMGSPDIISYAIERGWYNPEKDGEFLFKRAYSHPNYYNYDRNYVRHMSAMNYLTGGTYSTDPSDYPFAVSPNRKVGIEDMMQILTSHGDNVEVKIEQKKPSRHPVCICTDVTVTSTIFQLRNWLPVEYGAVMCATAASPCAEVYIPWYCGMTESPIGFERFSTAAEALEKHMSDSKDKRKNYPDGIAWKFVDRWHWVLEDYANRIGEVKAVNSKFQQKLFKNQKKFEKSLKKNFSPEKLNRYTSDIYEEYLKTF